MVAVWRRRFVTVQSAPAIENFLCWLGETPYEWYIASDGKLRAREHGEDLCAITGVVRHRTAVAFSVGDWMRAADTIGLAFGEAALIVAAADGTWTPDARVPLLRQRLLIASRIALPAGTPPVPFAAMDRELAELIAGHGRDLVPLFEHLDPVGMEHKR